MRVSNPSIGADCHWSRPFPCGTPSITSTRTTVRASCCSASRWAAVAPTLPAPTTVILLSMTQGQGLDQWQSAPIKGFDTRIIGANDYGPAAGSEVVVVTAGIARKPGMSRDDLVRTNADIVQ